MAEQIKKIAIIGGGTAGWLTAAIVASQHSLVNESGLSVVLVESSDIPTVGVGEGTWPTMKNTIRSIGISEKELFRQCHAAFKQGGKFVDWVHGNGDFYYHPFTFPLGYGRLDLAPYIDKIEDFAPISNFQHHICEAGLAPRQTNEREFSGQSNYAYHLDAGAFAEILKNFCRDNLGVQHMVATVKDVELDATGAISKIHMESGEQLQADLYVDCSGFQSLLLGKAMGVPFVSKDDVLFNDRALAVQVPYEQDSDPIATHTIATAQDAGWIWDIGLTKRRGVGHVYASKYLSDDEAANNLRQYLGETGEKIEPRLIKFSSGHRQIYWKKNCVAIGLSAGFVEPLEATAIMLVELSARFVAENLPYDTDVMQVVAKRFNEQTSYRWVRIIDFLKLHYMLNKRSEPYWQRHREKETIPESLQEDLMIWQHRGPLISDFNSSLELFPAASYQYVMYGMGFKPDFSHHAHLYKEAQKAEQIMQQNELLTDQMLVKLLPHRTFIREWLKQSA